MTTRRPDRRGRTSRVRVLAIHRYYWPDSPPYASMLRTIVARWVSDGAEVRVMGTQPTYKPEAEILWRPWREQLDGATVRRVRLLPENGSRLRRLLNIPLFVVHAMAQTIAMGRGDVVMCSTAPPVVLAAAVSLVARLKRAHFVYHCMDIHPEIGALSGEFRNPLVFRALRRLDRSTCRRAAAIVVLSQDMRTALLERDSALDSKIVVLNNFALPDFAAEAAIDQTPSTPPRPTATRRLVFTGNVGRFQGLEDVVTAVLESRADVDLVIMGEGKAKPELQRLVDSYPPEQAHRVIFRPYGTPAQARALMRTADVGVVSLVSGIVRYAYPSKTMTYLSEGLPLLLLAEQDSEIARTIRDERLGFTVASGDVKGLDRILEEIAVDDAALDAMRQRATHAAQTWFDTETLLERWANLLHRVRNRSEAGI